MMRLLFLTDRYWPAIGGVESLVRTIAHQLRDDGHQVQVVTIMDIQEPVCFAKYGFGAPAARNYNDQGIPVRILGAQPWQRIATLSLAIRYIPYLRSRAFGTLAELSLPGFLVAHQRTLERFAQRADVVHCFGAQYLGAAGLRAARHCGVPFVITPLCHPGHWGDDPMNVATYLRSDRVMALHEGDAATYVRMGVPRDRIHIMPVPLSRTSASVDGKSDRPTVVYLGRVNEYKGIGRLFDAWPAVRQRTGAELLVAGPADRPIEPPEGARYLGVVNEHDKEKLLASAWALVLPSRGEVMPNVILEAWAYGIPVIVSDIPALGAFVRHEVDGLVSSVDPAPLASSIIRCLEDRQLAGRVGDEGKRRVLSQHLPEAVTQGLLETYNLLSSRLGADVNTK
jgi:glycosyltransferase involved in cell wall biosynthesis